MRLLRDNSSDGWRGIVIGKRHQIRFGFSVTNGVLHFVAKIFDRFFFSGSFRR